MLGADLAVRDDCARHDLAAEYLTCENGVLTVRVYRVYAKYELHVRRNAQLKHRELAQVESLIVSIIRHRRKLLSFA